MCHSDEILKRIENFQVDDYELIFNIFPNQAHTKLRHFTDGDDDTKQKTEKGSTMPIKIYYRSSADKDMSVPETVRPPFVLFSSIQYLLSVIADCSYGDEIGKYMFIANRLRSVRQDFTVLFSKNANFRSMKKTIQSFELMVLAYLTFLNELRMDEKHDEKTLLDHFSESLNILMQCYSHQERHSKKLKSQNHPIEEDFCYQSNKRGDFMSMDLILHLFINSTGYIRRLSQFSGIVQDFFSHPKIKLVLLLQNCLESHNYEKYFLIMKSKGFIWHSFLNFWEFLFRVRLMIHSTGGFKSSKSSSEGQQARRMMHDLHLQSNLELLNLKEFFDDIDNKFLQEFGYQNKKDIVYTNHMGDIGNEKTKLKKFSSELIRNKFAFKSRWIYVQDFLKEGLITDSLSNAIAEEFEHIFSESDAIYSNLNKILLVDKTVPIGQKKEPIKADSKTKEVIPKKSESTEKQESENMPKGLPFHKNNISVSSSQNKETIKSNTMSSVVLNTNSSSSNVNANATLFPGQGKLENNSMFFKPKNGQKLSFENTDKDNSLFNQKLQSLSKQQSSEGINAVSTSVKPEIKSNKLNEMNNLFLKSGNTNNQMTGFPQVNPPIKNNPQLEFNNPKKSNIFELENSKDLAVSEFLPSSMQNQDNSNRTSNFPISENQGMINPAQPQSGMNLSTNPFLKQVPGRQPNPIEMNNSAPPSKSKSNPFIQKKKK
jgi:hypothetical protein